MYRYYIEKHNTQSIEYALSDKVYSDPGEAVSAGLSKCNNSTNYVFSVEEDYLYQEYDMSQLEFNALRWAMKSMPGDQKSVFMNAVSYFMGHFICFDNYRAHILKIGSDNMFVDAFSDLEERAYIPIIKYVGGVQYKVKFVPIANNYTESLQWLWDKELTTLMLVGDDYLTKVGNRGASIQHLEYSVNPKHMLDAYSMPYDEYIKTISTTNYLFLKSDNRRYTAIIGYYKERIGAFTTGETKVGGIISCL